ncbi:N-acetylglutaminylglutamine amidotransferase [Microbacterium oryzae]|uniref:N-acetylglutaminylglutamine amidotransferase n=1 Tax=Microbacterium oryzae TaxID=743009 RepID=UPI0025B27900|nr:N-acetylglutaminylglutamine amidotransferase [Microbacterium oryzae]MDN3310694.1 N-acetylglutaminylglutamine amidotransferase [Microbacterium oryzae]
MGSWTLTLSAAPFDENASCEIVCGIAGEIRFDSAAADQAAVRAMTESMGSRGPDGEGIWSGGWAVLGHRRLSVIDLTDAGAQPMADDDRGLALVFNGCIYNHEQLRPELASIHRFTSSSDTEVVLAAYERWGLDFVDHLVGMFAIVIVDARRRRVVLARDRLGIKPLYLAPAPGRLRFASTLPALLSGGDVDTSLDPVALHHFLSWHSIVPAPRTILSGVVKLPPATLRVIDHAGTVVDRTYWQPAYARVGERAGWSDEDWQEALHESLSTAVRRRLVSDVPVGVLLSGGLDSSLLVALLAETGHERIPTFSIGFETGAGGEGDEFVYSDAVARRFGTDHHRLRVKDRDLAAVLPRAVDAMTEPMGTQDVPAFYLLSEAVAEHVKVVQSGQGADEVFAGYAYHRNAIATPEGIVDGFASSFSDRNHAEMAQVLEPGWLRERDVSRELLEHRLLAPGAETPLDAVLRLDVHTLMPDDPVKRVDSMTMAFGLEARVPFLDQDLVALAASCPPELKSREGGKGVLKHLGRRMLPTEVIDRPKGYFPVPVLHHLDGRVLDLVTTTLTSPESRRRGLFRRDYVDMLLREPNARFTPVNGNMLWQLAVLELWLQRHGISS